MVSWAPRRYNTVADHLVNAALDQHTDFCVVDHEAFRRQWRSGGGFKLLVDGGLRTTTASAQPLAAIGGAIYIVEFVGTPNPKYTMVGWMAQQLRDVHSAFQTEVLALDSLIHLFMNVKTS